MSLRTDSQGAEMRTTENRSRYDRSTLRYPSDLTDNEWTLIEKLIPPAKRGGNKRKVIMREVVNGLMYVLSTGCQWNAIPKDTAARSTVNGYFKRWQHDHTLDRLHHAQNLQEARRVRLAAEWQAKHAEGWRMRG